MIENLHVDKNKYTVSWSSDRNSIVLIIPDVETAISDEVNRSVVVSINEGKFPTLIKVYDFQGNEIMTLKEPPSFEFYYIKKHTELGVSIICTTEQRINGRSDWQFGIDYEKKSLFRHCPSL